MIIVFIFIYVFDFKTILIFINTTTFVQFVVQETVVNNSHRRLLKVL